MNCFEARRDFAPMWRRALDEERRQSLIAHLRRCAKCDRAFRMFALSAPMLNTHGKHRAQASASIGSRRPAHPAVRNKIIRPAAIGPSVEARSRLVRLGAGVSAVAVAAMVAYLAASRPSELRHDPFGSFYSTVDLYGQEMPAFPNDLAG